MLLLLIILFVLLGSSVGRWMATILSFLSQTACEKDIPKLTALSFFKRSSCRKCQNLSFLEKKQFYCRHFFSLYKCPQCHTRYDAQILAWEAIIGVLFAGSLLFFPLSWPLFFVLCTTCLLMGCFYMDYHFRILPDEFTLTLVWVGLLASLSPIFADTHQAIWGATLGYAFFWILNEGYCVFRGHQGMFHGDFKLNAGIGACIGVQWLIPVLMLSFLSIAFISGVQFFCHRKQQKSSQLKESYLHQEVAYGCYSSVVAIMALFVLLYQSTLFLD